MKNIVIIFLILTMTSAWAGDRYPFVNVNQEARFNQLMQQFRCLVCQNEDLASSNAVLAGDLRQQIYQMIVAGKSNVEITQYMVNRYGDFVLFKPPLDRETLFIWSLPFLLLISGVVIFYFVIRKYSRNV